MRVSSVIALIVGVLCCVVAVQGMGYRRGHYDLPQNTLQAMNERTDMENFVNLVETHEAMTEESASQSEYQGSTGEYQGSVGTSSEYQGTVNTTSATKEYQGTTSTAPSPSIDTDYQGTTNSSEASAEESSSATTEYQGEYQGEYQAGVPVKKGMNSSLGDAEENTSITMPDRVFNKDDCNACISFIGSLSNDAIQDKLTRYEIVLQAQTQCQQDPDLKDHLKLRCNVFDDVEYWLVKGGIIQAALNEVQEYDRHMAADLPKLTAAKEDPRAICRSFDICSNSTEVAIFNANSTATAVNGTSKAAPVDTEPKTYVVRFVLKVDINKIPRSSDKWKQFVVTFLNDISSVLSIPSSRLQLHAHAADDHVEVIINPLGKSDTVAADGSEHNAHHPSKALAVLFKRLIDAKDPSLETPNKLLATIDTDTSVDVLPLLIDGHSHK